MAITGFTTGNYLWRASPVFPGEPYMVSAWGFRAVPHGTTTAFYTDGQEGANPGTGRRIMFLNGEGDVSVEANDNLAGQAAEATALAPDSTWFHASGAFVSSTLREAWMNGVNKGTSTLSVTPAAPDSTFIGVTTAPSAPWNSGAVAEYSVWNLAGFTETNRNSLSALLAAGDNPRAINAQGAQPWTGALDTYWRLGDLGDIADLSGNGNGLTAVGSLSTFASHPPVDPVPGASLLLLLHARGDN